MDECEDVEELAEDRDDWLVASKEEPAADRRGEDGRLRVRVIYYQQWQVKGNTDDERCDVKIQDTKI